MSFKNTFKKARWSCVYFTSIEIISKMYIKMTPIIQKSTSEWRENSSILTWRRNFNIDLTCWVCWYNRTKLVLMSTQNHRCFNVNTAWKKKFRLTKICEKDRKDHIFISFRMFPFRGNIIFSEFCFKQKCKKAASSSNAYSCVNMKFLYAIAVRKDEIFYVVL